MEWGPRFLHERYGLPIFITENGLSCTDRIHLDGKVHDPERIDFTHRYLLALRQGIEAGADVQGTSTGRCWIILSGARDTTSGLAWCM